MQSFKKFKFLVIFKLSQIFLGCYEYVLELAVPNRLKRREESPVMERGQH